MKKVLIMFFVLLIFPIGNKIFSQCIVNASPDSIIVCEGDELVISASSSCEDIVFSDDFNNSTLGAIWSSNASPVFTNPCNPDLNGSAYLWIGPASDFPRQLVTQPFDVSEIGCKISFYMKYATQGFASPCEGPDRSTEGVHLQYSLNDSLGPWTDINYWNPNGGNDPSRTSWNLYIENIPALAVTTNTAFRWYQALTSSNDFDHWGLENVQIICPSNQGVSWEHGPTALSPPPVYPINDTMFIISVYDSASGVQNQDTVFVSFYTLPSIYSITGGGSYIVGGNGVSIGLDNSEIGVDYSLIRNGLSTIVIIPGTGSSIDFGLQLSAGTFTVRAENQTSNCTQLMNDSAIITIVNSIEENKIADFNIYPNPTNGLFTVEGENIELISISDISGKLILKMEVKKDMIEIDLNGYSKGIYLIRVYTELGMGVKKILME